MRQRDRPFAKNAKDGAPGKVYANTTRDNSEASEDWHNQLKKNCH
jgi:hypothetical protein